MRTHTFLDALAADHDVHLVIAAVVGHPPTPAQRRDLAARCAAVRVFPLYRREDPAFARLCRLRARRARWAGLLGFPTPVLGRFARPEVADEVAALFPRVAFEAVHVERLYLAPLVRPFLDGRRAVCALDLDDWESKARARLAGLYRRLGRHGDALHEAAEAGKYARWEAAWLPRFDRVYVCSSRDRRELGRRLPAASLRVIPNAVSAPPARPAKRPGLPFTFLFVGTLGNFPNEDAVTTFAGRVLPVLRARARSTLRFVVVGPRPPATVRALARLPDVTVTGEVDDVAPWYRDSDVVVVPLRAGGGTRVKILEAFAFERAVVSTTIGLEGIDAAPGRHVLVADEPERFAAHCLALMRSPRRRTTLARRARALLRRRYATPVIARLIRRARPR